MILQKCMEEVNEILAWDIFDLLCHDYTITFKEFCLMVLILAAAEVKETNVLLYMHG